MIHIYCIAKVVYIKRILLKKMRVKYILQSVFLHLSIKTRSCL